MTKINYPTPIPPVVNATISNFSTVPTPQFMPQYALDNLEALAGKRSRPSWDEYFMNIARQVSTRSTCERKQIGAVFVNCNRRIVATGYNGSPPDERHCVDDGCRVVDGHCVRTIHAEVNALIHAAKDGIALGGTDLYIAGAKPCYECAKLLVSMDLNTLVYDEDYGSDDGLILLYNHLILIDRYDWEKKEAFRWIPE